MEKEELMSPEGKKYLIKYPRQFKVGVSWEDLTELIAAEIGAILGLETMDVEIVRRNHRRGCLLRNFVDQYNPKMNEEGGSLLNMYDDYQCLLETKQSSYDLIEYGFSFIKRLPYWEVIKPSFINMQLFDILIGNQDRHPFNWLVLFFSDQVRFSPLYDNGASLGFRFDDQQLEHMVANEAAMNRYTKKAKVKAGMFEKKQVKAKELLSYLLEVFPSESEISLNKLRNLDTHTYSAFIRSLDVLSDAQKLWLLHIIPFRKNKILEWVEKEET